MKDQINYIPEVLYNCFETIVIPDLHGNFEAYKNILLRAWLVDANMDWIWDNTQVKFLWDIIFDRHFNWIKILESISKLRFQAQKYWWELSVIAWNHENFWITKFANPKSSINTLDRDNIHEQMRWSIEFIERFWEKEWWTLIEKIRNTQKWKRILTDISKFKLVDRTGWNLFVHTDMTKNMVKSILWFWIEYLNTSFQNRVFNVLLKWENIQSPLQVIMNTFLNTNNRWYYKDNDNSIFSNKEWLLLKEMWIDNIFHWHTHHWLDVINIWWVNNIPLDLNYWMWLSLKEWTETFAKITNMWEIYIITQWSSEQWDKLHNFFRQ